MNSLTSTVHRPKAGITAIGFGRQSLRFFNVGFRLMNIVQLTHQ